MAVCESIRRLEERELAVRLEALPSWRFERERQAIHRRIARADFIETFGLMTEIAIAAEKRDHHPEWCNVYNVLDVWLTTHDVGGVSERDLELAVIIDALAQED
jgi:4a-hydroxytetrahydrobiopterin dehydratase